MSWENLEGGQESSHHTGEIYRQRVEEYLESGEYLKVGDPYSGTSDIRLVRPALNEDKVFRVETKNKKASLAKSSLLTTLARHFIDYYNFAEEFEVHVFVEDCADQPRWKRTFRDRTRDRDAVEHLYTDIQEKHGLKETEASRLNELNFDQFWRFLETVHVRKASFDRLGEMIEQNEREDRRRKQFEFYIRENEPMNQEGTFLPNFLEIADYPELVWEVPAWITDPEELYEKNPRYLPVWVESGTLYSLIPPDQMTDSLAKFVNTEKREEIQFKDWLGESETTRRIGKILLNRQLTWRGTQIQDHCDVIHHDGEYKLIFTTTRPVQHTLTGEQEDGAERTSEDGYTVTITVKGVVGHRYASISVKEYADEFYPFISTGWVFSEEGLGQDVITGDQATSLHHWMRSHGYDQISNHRTHLKQWLKHLRTGISESNPPHLSELGNLDSDQLLKFTDPSGLSLPVRPPNNSKERQSLMEGRQP